MSSNNNNIRSKIANFENESRRRSGAGSSPSSPSPQWRSGQTSQQRRQSAGENSPANRSQSSIDGGVTSDPTMIQQPKLSTNTKQNAAGGGATKASMTAATVSASQNRISRLRQQQAGKGKSPSNSQGGGTAGSSVEPGVTNRRVAERRLSERKHTKERRLMKHKQFQQAPAASAANNNSGASSKVDLARRTTYQQSQESQNQQGGNNITASSSGRNNSRKPMIQRLQKMKEKELKQLQSTMEQQHQHGGDPRRSSVAGSAATNATAGTLKSTATTAVADQNLSSSNGNNNRYLLSRRLQQQQQTEPSQQQQQSQSSSGTHRPQHHNRHHERRRKDLREKRRSDMQRSTEREASHSPVPNHNDVVLDDPGAIYSPNAKNNNNDYSFSQFASSSPRGTDTMFSEDHLEANASFNAMSDHITDDEEATLTSVRRVMAGRGDVPDSPLLGEGDRSGYQHLLPSAIQSPHGTDVTNDNDPIPGGKFARHRHQGTSSKNSTSGDDFSDPRSPTLRANSKVGGGYNRYNSTDKRGNESQSNRHNRREWIIEEKSDKMGGGGGFDHRVFAASSSDYDTDGDVSKTSKTSKASKTSRHSHLMLGPSHSQATDANDFFSRSKYTQNKRQADDDDSRTFETYEEHDDDSAGSYVARRRKEKQRRDREAAAAAAAAAAPESTEAKDMTSPTSKGDQSDFNLLNKDDVEHYTGSFDDPMAKVGIGVAGAVAVGCLIMGPAGLLIGAAAVGLGVGAMQIPEEKRNKLQTKAKQQFNEIQEKAMDASEKITVSCGTAYNDSGMAEHIPIPMCPAKSEAEEEKDNGSTRSEKRIRGAKSDTKTGIATKGGAAKPANHQPGPQQDTNAGMPSSPTQSNDKIRNKKVACLRNVGILPASQIHGLDPAAQPRAWLDVIASANTTGEEKIEAIEEILILAKDKRRARIFLDEGILDWIIWTLSRFFEKTNAVSQDVNWANPEITPTEKQAAKLAAMCCVTLGKAHCAAIHTEGDLLLMSMYERGTVPEVRQVAQMLHEVPHHVRITKTSDPTIIDPGKEVFSLRQLTLPQAEDLAKSVMEVADCRI